jgi:26S proteasome regulatory subunit T5
MSSSTPPPPPSNPPDDDQQSSQVQAEGEMDTTPDPPLQETWEDIPEDVMALSTDEILTRIRLIENDIKVSTL